MEKTNIENCLMEKEISRITPFKEGKMSLKQKEIEMKEKGE